MIDTAVVFESSLDGLKKLRICMEFGITTFDWSIIAVTRLTPRLKLSYIRVTPRLKLSYCSGSLIWNLLIVRGSRWPQLLVAGVGIIMEMDPTKGCGFGLIQISFILQLQPPI